MNKVLCAIGMVYPAKQVHGKSVLQGHAKVHVDNVVADYKDYLLPVPTEKFSKIGETVLSFIQWPKNYIELNKASNSNQTGNKKIMAANTPTQTATKQVVATNKEPYTRKQTSPTLSRQERPSNHISAASLTKSARLLNSIGFILDSEREGKNEESYEFTNVVHKAFGNMKWNLVECNQQRHYWECEYYVMKWMHQFVTHQQHTFLETVTWNDKKPFTTKELDDIVGSCISARGI
nr:ulp1 protease family, C-terminal catalytic domain-containing protein [Tanacetum cinerariifolium]